MSFTPSQQVLERYADVLVNFALGGGAGVKRGDVVRIVAHEAAKPLYVELHRAVVARRRPRDRRTTCPTTTARPSTSRATSTSSPATSSSTSSRPTYMRGLIDQIDHQVSVISDTDMHALEGVDPALIMRSGLALQAGDRVAHREGERRPLQLDARALRDAGDGGRGRPLRGGVLGADHPRLLPRRDRSDRALARGDAGRSSELRGAAQRAADRAPARRGRGRRPARSRSASGASGWGAAAATSRASRSSRARTGAARRAGSPSTSRSTATATSSRGVRLEFSQGRVVDGDGRAATSTVLKEMVATENADKVGEFSLTDRRFSRITKFMAETLYDENVGGPFGNTHIALGKSYHDGYAGDPGARRRGGVGAPRLQRLDRAHRHRLDHRPHRHGDAARRQRARHLRRRRVPG